ncbi:MAG: C4-dicarboxylate ABC transporter substrate-binding protein [Burkholderiales bacterium]|nr:MAG: C4-dicarboxylate ABC transporter substrate-binding protein [Burkholderiales bacterium]
MVRKRLRISQLSGRDLLFAVAPLVVAVAAGLWLAYQFVKPAPPDTLVITTGDPEGGYHHFAQRYREILARDGVKLEIETSGGSLENVARLMNEDSPVEVGFVQGGTGSAANAPNLVSLGTMYYEPLWVFYRAPHEITRLTELRGKRIAVGGDLSGTRALALMLLAVNHATQPPTRLVFEGGNAATELLLQGKIDALFVVGSPEAPVIRRLLASPGVRLMSFDRAEAYTRRFPFLTQVVLPQGALDLARDLPARDVTLLAPSATLVAKDSLHPALAYLLLRAATEVHGEPGLFARPGEFPSGKDTDFPLSDEARRYYRSGPPFLQRYLPYWAANLVDRLWVMLLPIVALAIPLSRIVPPLYAWRVHSRIYKWYAKLKAVELDLEEERDPGKLRELLERLDAIEEAVNRIPMPLAYTDRLYTFRLHIHLVRRRIALALARERSDVLPID